MTPSCDGAVLSHHSAAALWGIRPAWRGEVYVTAAAGKVREGIRVHRSRAISSADITRHHGIPVTTALRTLVDLAAHRLPRPLVSRLTGSGERVAGELRRLLRPARARDPA